MSVHNLTKGCHIVFEEAVFSGHFRNATFEGHRTIGGEIVADKYQKNGHCFTILLDHVSGTDAEKYKVGQKIRRFGRNVYPCLERVTYPDNFEEAQKEKRSRSLEWREQTKAAKELKDAWRWATGNGR